MKDCFFCEKRACLEKNKYFDSRYWEVLLHPSGVYLGRSTLVLKRHAEEEFDLFPEEIKEATSLRHFIDKAIREEFGACKTHYHFAGVEVPHAHWHLIPRYRENPMINGFVFEDKNSGKNYSPYDKSVKMPDKVRLEVLSRLRKAVIRL